MQSMRSHEEHSSCLPRLLCSHLLYPISTDQLSLLFQAGLQNTSLTCLLIYIQAQESLFSGRDWPASLDLSSQDLTQESGFVYPFHPLGLRNQVRTFNCGCTASSCSRKMWRYVWGWPQEACGRGYEMSIHCFGGCREWSGQCLTVWPRLAWNFLCSSG